MASTIGNSERLVGITNNYPINNLIIAGTNKAATSSVFTYLSAHKRVCGSSIKEINFFEKNYTGDKNIDLKNYIKYFTKCLTTQKDVQILLEASPGYLANSDPFALRIKTLLPKAKILFILRDPITRIYSYYNFQLAQLNIPKEISFKEYVRFAIDYETLDHDDIQKLAFDERHLKALDFGNYASYLQNYYQVFHHRQIRVMFYEHLKNDIQLFMEHLCQFLEIDPAFYDSYTFRKVNVTFSSKVKVIHKIALAVNKLLENYLRQKPMLKDKIVSGYKWINQKHEGYSEIPDNIKTELKKYYSESNKELAQMLSGQDCPSWVE